jgi:hypothetical protein
MRRFADSFRGDPERRVGKLTISKRLFVDPPARVWIMRYSFKEVLAYVSPWYGKFYETGGR